MSIITIFDGSYCNATPIIKEIMIRKGYELVEDNAIVTAASRLSAIPPEKIQRAFSSKVSVFNKFTHEREQSIAYLKLALAQRIAEDRLLLWGMATHLIPESISHILRVCLIADAYSRAKQAAAENGVSEIDALRLVHQQDTEQAAWVQDRTGHNDPWDIKLYDMVLPTTEQTPKESADIVCESLYTETLRPTRSSRQAVKDFLLSAEVEVALVKEGHSVGVVAENGAVTLTINKHVLMLNRLKNELKTIAEKIPGVDTITIEVGSGFYKTDIYRRADFEMPSKILLVDDEREFVQTLSERLEMRDLGSAVAYDGESALEVVQEDEPEVMILDLRMPGIDGIEVLRRVKASQPEIEIIILTGHGSEADRKMCMELGAFDYLQKPVEIEALSASIEKANEKIRQKRSAGE